jgi:hypothetical protein
MAMNARIAVIAPKTISSQMDLGPRSALRTTQIPREQMARLNSFTCFYYLLYWNDRRLPWQ